MTAALCKYRGQLVLMEATKSDGGGGNCPDCGAKEFTERAGWVECDCGFAILAAHHRKIVRQRKVRVRL